MIVLENIWGDRIDEIWPLLEPFIARSIARSPNCDLTPEHIRTQAKATRLHLWAVYESDQPLPLLGAAVTGVHDQDGKQVCECFAMSGRLFSTWAEAALARFEELARAHGVRKLIFSGRRGCQRNRTYQRLGFRLVGDVMEKDLG